MRLRTPADLGLVPYRDHREAVGPSFAFYAPSSVDGRYAGYGYRIVDRETDSPKEIAVEPGDEQGRYFWAPGQARVNPSSTDAIAGRRPIGSWWGGPAVGQIVESLDASAVSTGSFGVVTTPASSTNPSRFPPLGVLPYLDRSLAVDDRYAALRVIADRPPPIRPKDSDTRIRVVLPPPGRELPADHPGIVAAGTEEHAQETLFVPSGGVLVSHWRPVGPNRFSTLCYDVRGSRLDALHAGPLDSAWRVTALDAADAFQSTDPRYRPPAALAWAGLRAPEHRRAGRGLTAHQDADIGVPISVIDRTTALGTQSGHLVVNAYHALEGGGALTAGGPECQHRFFKNVDGEDFVPGHLQAGALFWAGDAFDAPLDFQLRPYPEPPAKPYTTRVHLVYDSGSPHRWFAGDVLDARVGRGIWRWYAETNFGPYTPPPWDGHPPPIIDDPPARRDVPAVQNPKKDIPVPEPDRSRRGEGRQSKKVFEIGAAKAQEKAFRKAGGFPGGHPPLKDQPTPHGAKGGQQVGGGGKQQGKHGGGFAGGPARKVFGAGVQGVTPKDAILDAGRKPGDVSLDKQENVVGGKILPEGARRRLDAGLDPNPTGARVIPEGAQRRLDVGLDPNPGGAQVLPPGSPKRFQPGIAPVDVGDPVVFNVAAGLRLPAEAPTFEYTPMELAGPSWVALPTRSWVPEEDLRYRRSPASAAESRVNQSAPATGRLAAFGIANRGPQKAPGWDFTHRAGHRSKTLSGTGPGGLAFLPPELGLEDVLCGEPPTFHRARAVSASTFALLRTALGFLDCYDPRYGAVDGYVLDRGPSNGIRMRSLPPSGTFAATAWTLAFNGVNLDFTTTGAGSLMQGGRVVSNREGVSVTTATYTTTDTDGVLFCDGDVPAANIAITFHAAAAANRGNQITIKNIGTAGGAKNVTYTARDTTSASSLVTLLPGSSGYVASDGSNWYHV